MQKRIIFPIIKRIELQKYDPCPQNKIWKSRSLIRHVKYTSMKKKIIIYQKEEIESKKYEENVYHH